MLATSCLAPNTKMVDVAPTVASKARSPSLRLKPQDTQQPENQDSEVQAVSQEHRQIEHT
eukprot:419920-Amphidinium_carterae.3